jgi:hypothetical protein
MDILITTLWYMYIWWIQRRKVHGEMVQMVSQMTPSTHLLNILVECPCFATGPSNFFSPCKHNSQKFICDIYKERDLINLISISTNSCRGLRLISFTTHFYSTLILLFDISSYMTPLPPSLSLTQTCSRHTSI